MRLDDKRMGTAKLNGMDPLAYLTAVLKRINNTPITEVAELLPWNIDLTKSKYLGCARWTLTNIARFENQLQFGDPDYAG